MKGRVDLTFSVYRTITRGRHCLPRSLVQPRATAVCTLKDRGFGTDLDNGNRSPPNGWTERGGRERTVPQINMSVTRGNILKMSVASASGAGPTQFMYQNIDFSGLEARLQSVPRWMRWVPHFISKRFYAVLMAQAKRRLLAEDFNENEFYHYAALAAMKISDHIMRGEKELLSSLVAEEAELAHMEHPLKGIEKDVSAVHMSSEEDLVHIRRGPVILYNLDNASELVRLTLFVLCKANMEFAEHFTLPSDQFSLLPANLRPSSMVSVAIRRLACTFEQHVHFSKDRTKEHSQWKAAEFSQELLLVPVPVFNRSTLKH